MNKRLWPLSLVYKRRAMQMITDLYQVTMAAGYFENGMAEREAVFNLHFRKNPFGGGYSVCSGLTHSIDYLKHFFGFDARLLDSLSMLRGNDKRPLFKDRFLNYLGDMKFTCDVDAIAEGSVVFPNEPLIRVRGPIIQGQLVETPLLTLNNFGTLIATKAARVKYSAQGDPVINFGLRRAQGFDGALLADWAAFIAGTDGTSNVASYDLFGIPCKGTHAHSWVMSFDEEIDSFYAYAKALSNNCVFLVDTYNTIEGVKNAVKVGLWLRSMGFEMIGVRLDSGKLKELSIEARKILDDAGFPNAQVFGTNDLDEYKIAALKLSGARIGVWGVGTMMVTAFDQPALGGVYKLGAIKDEGGAWHDSVKLSEDKIKTSIPGFQQVRRYSKNGMFVGDAMYDERFGFTGDIVDLKSGRTTKPPRGADYQDIVEPIFRQGRLVYKLPVLAEAKAHSRAQQEALPEKVRKLTRPARYPVGLETQLHDLRERLIDKHAA